MIHIGKWSAFLLAILFWILGYLSAPEALVIAVLASDFKVRRRGN